MDAPLAWIFNLAALALMVFNLWIYAPPTRYVLKRSFLLPELPLYGWGFLATLLLARLVIWKVVGSVCKKRNRYLAPLRHRWTWIPAVAAITLVLLLLDVPRQTAFFLSRPALSRLVEEARAHRPGDTLPPRRVGFYDADEIAVTPTGVRFHIQGSGDLFEKAGLRFGTGSYAPDNEPMHDGWLVWRKSAF